MHKLYGCMESLVLGPKKHKNTRIPDYILVLRPKAKRIPETMAGSFCYCRKTPFRQPSSPLKNCHIHIYIYMYIVIPCMCIYTYVCNPHTVPLDVGPAKLPPFRTRVGPSCVGSLGGEVWMTGPPPGPLGQERAASGMRVGLAGSCRGAAGTWFHNARNPGALDSLKWNLLVYFRPQGRHYHVRGAL